MVTQHEKSPLSSPESTDEASLLSDIGRALYEATVSQDIEAERVAEHASIVKRERTNSPRTLLSSPKKLQKVKTEESKQGFVLTNCRGTKKDIKEKMGRNGISELTHHQKKSTPKRWSENEDEALRKAVEESGEKNWKAIARLVLNRNHTQCLQRWTKVLKPGLVKGHWTEKEDFKLREIVNGGTKNWGEVAAQVPGRTSKQCRERWCNHLDPSIVKGAYTAGEDSIIYEMQAKIGNKWSVIAQQLEGRTEDAVKIRWKSLMRNRKASQHQQRTKDRQNTMRNVQTKNVSSHNTSPSIDLGCRSDSPWIRPISQAKCVENVMAARPISLNQNRVSSTLLTQREEWGNTVTPRSKQQQIEGRRIDLLQEQRLNLLLKEEKTNGLFFSPRNSPGQSLLTQQLTEQQRLQREKMLLNGWNTVATLGTDIEKYHYTLTPASCPQSDASLEDLMPFVGSTSHLNRNPTLSIEDDNIDFVSDSSRAGGCPF